MRKSHFIGSILLLTLCLVAQVRAGSLQDLDKKHGFRDAVLGMPIDSIHNLILVKDMGYYIRKGDELKIGDAILDQIEYRFCRKRLRSITIICDKKHWDYLMDIFTTKYGEPTDKGISPLDEKRNQSMTTSFWYSKKMTLGFTYPYYWINLKKKGTDWEEEKLKIEFDGYSLLSQLSPSERDSLLCDDILIQEKKARAKRRESTIKGL